MGDIVLIHGAWQGNATWDLVVPELEKAGHRVVRPQLSGMGEDTPRLSGEFNLETHVRDVVETMEEEHLRHVTLVGHCYGGMVITGVAEEAPSRVDRLVYVNAFVPGNDQSALDLMPSAIRQKFRLQAEADGGGWRLRASENLLDLWGLRPGRAREFVRKRLCDFSLRFFEQALMLWANAAAGKERAYVACAAEDFPVGVLFEPQAARAKREGWRYYEMPTGHHCQVERPHELTTILLGLIPEAPELAGAA